MRRVDGQQERLSDAEIEEVFSGGGPDDLSQFIEAVRSFVTEPNDDGFVATRLATTSQIATQGRVTRVRRLATLTLAGALVVAFAVAAVASDGAAPGDLLYPIDQSLEHLGFNDGGVDERMAEYDTLIGKGQQDAADDLIERIIEAADELETERAIHHLSLANQKSNPQAAEAQLKVAEIQEFIAANKGPGVGLDGRDFGQAVSEIARSSKDARQTGPPDQTGPKEGKTNGKPDHAGAKKDK